jgi:hypothetical protein
LTKRARRVRARGARGARHHDHEPLQLARKRLTDAIADLIDPRPVGIEGTISYQPSRYDVLRDAVTGRPTSTPRHHQLATTPGWLEAMTLASDIQSAIGAMPIDTTLTVLRLRALERRRWRPQDTHEILDHANRIAHFATLIDALFAPRPRYLAGDACPHCGATHAARHVDDQTIKTPALAITDTGAACGACGDTWAPEQLPFLAGLLGYPLPPGVIQEGAQTLLAPTGTDTP